VAGSGGYAGGGVGGIVTCTPSCSATTYCSAGSCKTRFTEFQVGNTSDPSYITSGSDNNLWFTTGVHTGGPVGGSVGRITPNGTPTLFPILSNAQNPNNLTVYAVGIASGADGNLWFDALSADGRGYVSMMTPAGLVSNYLFSMTLPRPGRVAAAPDGNTWVALTYASPSGGSDTMEVSTTTGLVTERTLPSYSNPYGVVGGPDGNVWFTETAFNEIGRFKLADNSVSEFATSAQPQNITVGGDGNLWFTEPSGSIGRSTIGGTVLEFPAPNGPWDICKGPDGNVWFTEPSANMIARITPGGQVSEFAAPSSPYGITAGPDGNIWFTEPSAGKVTRFVVP
jgi:streptogramin lyase